MWFSFVLALGASTLGRVNPVEKVTTLLTKLQAEVQEEGKAEAAAYDKYACFCKEQADNKQYAIENFIKQEGLLDGKILDKGARKAKLDNEVTAHNQDITRLEGEAATAQNTRESEHAAYSAREAELSKNIKSMQGAIAKMSGSKGEMKDAAAGYTLLSKYRGAAKAQGVDLQLLQNDPHAYTFHANDIIQTLQNLLKTFKEKKVEVDNDERAFKQEYEMIAGARHNQISSLKKSASEKSSASAALDEELSEHNTDLLATEAAHAADNNFLNDLVGKCEQKATDFDQRSSTRANELVAISKALELLKGDVSKMFPSTNLGLVTRRSTTSKAQPKAGGHWEWVADKPAAATVPAKADDSDDDDSDDVDDSDVSFLQVKRGHKGVHKKLVGFLTKKAQALKSAALSTLLIKLRDTSSPFTKVKQMIQDLVSRLEQEAADEASQKTWCDQEMAQTTAERDEAQRKIEDYTATHTEKSALVDQLTEEMATLAKEIADLEKALNEQTELRNEEKAANEQTIADSQAGFTAVSQAIDFLEDFYGTSLIQQKPANAAEGYERFVAADAGSDGKTVDDMAPDAGGVSGNYEGKTGASKSIIGLLEVIKTDFQNSVDKTGADEGTASGNYETFKSDTEQSISDKTALKGDKETAKTNAEVDITEAEADLKTERKQLQLALDELLKLKPVCVDSGASWAERAARRKQEIEALKEALKIFQETDFGFLQQ